MKSGLKFLRLFFYPLAFIYGLVVFIRNVLFDLKILKSTEFTLPIISVGNITVGGTGKTPHIEYLVRLLKDDFAIATLSRGYKRKTNGFILAGDNSSSEEIGDEPRQIKQKFSDILVAVDANRVRGINRLLQEKKDLKAILLDDAFQHRYVAPGLNILLVDFNRPLKDDKLLPVGMLREPAAQRERADIIIVTKCPQKLKPIEQRLIEKDLKMYAYQKVYFTTFEYGEPVAVFKKYAREISFSEMREGKPFILLLTGIANPRPLKTHVRGISTKIEEIEYPDHYNYDAKDLHSIIERFSAIQGDKKYIITTEKDAMRLQQFADLDEELKAIMYYIPVSVKFLEPDEQANFNHQITSYVRNNKPDNILHKQQNNKKA